jgi:Acetyltransferase (GNAT) domain
MPTKAYIKPRFQGTCRSRMVKSDSDLEVKLFNSILDIPIKEWNNLIGAHHQFINPTYLEAIQKAHSESLEVRYVMYYQGNSLIGVAAFQITHFKTNSDSYQNPLMRFLAKLGAFIRAGHVHNILIAGNAFATGEHGFYFLPAITPSKQAAAIVTAMDMISSEERRRGKKICAMLVKDMYSMSAELCQAFKHYSFSDFNIDHNMIMPIDPEWKSFDDYLKILNTKFRTKAKGAYKKSALVTSIKPSGEWILENCDRMQELYEAVHEKADFRLGKLDLEVLNELLRVNWTDFEVRTYHLNDQCIGFLTAVICGDRCEAHIVGLDYEFNREHGVYQRMLYDYVNIAIERRCKYLVFGRTAAEIKSTVGAFPVDLTVLMRHRKRISNTLLSLILTYVKPSLFPQRQPYQAEYAKQLESQFTGLLADCRKNMQELEESIS